MGSQQENGVVKYAIEALNKPFYYDGEPMASDIPRMPVLAYDVEHQERWEAMMGQGDLSDMTINTLHTVNGRDVPLRWLVSVIDTAKLMEGMQEVGITPPSEWKTLAPIHINTACNTGIDDPEELVDVAEESREAASSLLAFTHSYLDQFHPTVIKPEMVLDDPNAVPAVFAKARELHGVLPDDVHDDLESMAGNHNHGDIGEEARTAYLIAHYNAYGLVNGTSGIHLFPEMRDVIYVLPQSEDRFITLMQRAEGALRETGIHPGTFEGQNTVITMSDILRTAHYYAHEGEPTLNAIRNPQQLPSANRVSHVGLNEYARQEVIAALQRIEEAIGGRTGIPGLVKAVNTHL
jgi:hypothetical protein